MEDLGDPPPTAYWLAWATAFLLIIAVVSAGVMNLNETGSDDGFVSAAGQTPGTVDVSSTTTLPPAAPAQTSTTTRRPATPTSTTVPNAAAAVLRAIGTTAPPASTTTAPPLTSTTATTATTTSTTTSTTLAPKATVTVVNEHPRAFEITVNGRSFSLGPAPDSAPQTAQIDVPANAPDEIKGGAVGDPACQVAALGDLFRAGGNYKVAIVAGGTCAELKVTSV